MSARFCLGTCTSGRTGLAIKSKSTKCSPRLYTYLTLICLEIADDVCLHNAYPLQGVWRPRVILQFEVVFRVNARKGLDLGRRLPDDHVTACQDLNSDALDQSKAGNCWPVEEFLIARD